MAWDDVLFGVLTGGLYNVGKAAYKAGEAAEDAGDAAEQAGIALAVIGSTVESLGKQLESLLKETEELITINRLTPRSESDLWEEEKERLDALRQRKTQLENKLADLGMTEPSFSFDFGEFLTNFENMLEKLRLMSMLVVVNKEIHDILYQEPGVVTTAIYNASEALERFNTIEQPKIEDILDGVEDNLEVSEETLREIKKLFVERKKVLIPELELSPAVKDKLKLLEKDTLYFKGLVDKKSTISTQLITAMDKIPATKFDISEKGIKVEGAVSEVSRDLQGDIVRTTAGMTPAKRPVEKKGDVNVSSRNFALKSNISTDAVKMDTPTLGMLNLALAKKPVYSMATMQPQGAKISATLNTKFDGYQRKFDLSRAQMKFYDREILKTAWKIDKLKYRWEDEPGVIPRTLDEVEQILERVRTQEQPRIDTVLDTLNENLEESKETLSKVNDSLDSVQGGLTFFNTHGNMIKLGLGIFGAVVFLDFLVALIVLVKMALGI